MIPLYFQLFKNCYAATFYVIDQVGIGQFAKIGNIEHIGKVGIFESVGNMKDIHLSQLPPVKREVNVGEGLVIPFRPRTVNNSSLNVFKRCQCIYDFVQFALFQS